MDEARHNRFFIWFVWSSSTVLFYWAVMVVLLCATRSAWRVPKWDLDQLISCWDTLIFWHHVCSAHSQDPCPEEAVKNERERGVKFWMDPQEQVKKLEKSVKDERDYRSSEGGEGAAWTAWRALYYGRSWQYILRVRFVWAHHRENSHDPRWFKVI